MSKKAVSEKPEGWPELPKDLYGPAYVHTWNRCSDLCWEFTQRYVSQMTRTNQSRFHVGDIIERKRDRGEKQKKAIIKDIDGDILTVNWFSPGIHKCREGEIDARHVKLARWGDN